MAEGEDVFMTRGLRWCRRGFFEKKAEKGCIFDWFLATDCTEFSCCHKGTKTQSLFWSAWCSRQALL